MGGQGAEAPSAITGEVCMSKVALADGRDGISRCDRGSDCAGLSYNSSPGAETRAIRRWALRQRVIRRWAKASPIRPSTSNQDRTTARQLPDVSQAPK